MSRWDDVIGHVWAVEHLQASIQQSRVGHAYLFTGPGQVGKATVARIFAQALICDEPLDERPCGRCRSCTLTAASRHPDVPIVSGEVSARGIQTVKIDQVRELQQVLSLTATEARLKIALLENFDAANANAANAFLKTLEEPPRNVILMLTAADEDSLPQTIVSRCRSIALRPVDAKLIAGALQTRWQVSPEDADLIARLADGRPGWAIQAANDRAVLRQREERLAELYEALGQSRTERFAVAMDLSSDPIVLPQLLRSWLSWWRDLALLAHEGASEATVTNVDQFDRLTALAGAWKRAEIVHSLRVTEASLWQLEHNANARLVMENLFLTYPGAAALPF